MTGPKSLPWSILCVVLLIGVSLLALDVQAEVLGLAMDDGSNKTLVSINTSTGVATDSSTGSVSMGALVGGGGYQPANGYVYMPGYLAGDTDGGLFVINPTTGALSSSLNLTLPSGTWSETPYFVVSNGSSQYGLFHDSSDGLEKLAQIDGAGIVSQPWTSEHDLDEVPFGLGTLRTASNLLVFVGQAAGETDWRVFGVNLSNGSLSSSAVLAPGGSFDDRPLFLENNPGGGTYGIFRNTSSGNVQMGSINRTNGAVTFIGSEFAADDTSLGVSTYDYDNNIFYFAANSAGTPTLFRVVVSSGAVTSYPLTRGGSPFMPLQLTYQSGGTGAGTVPNGYTIPGTQLTVVRNGSLLDISWGNTCGSEAVDYTLHWGTIGSYYDHTKVSCTTGGATTISIGQNSGDYYFIVVPISASEEGSYGERSSGAERPRSSTTCKTNQESSSCP